MLHWIYDLSIRELAFWGAIISVGYYWIGCVLLRPILRPFVRSRFGSNEVVGNVLSCFGVFYGLLLGLIMDLSPVVGIPSTYRVVVAFGALVLVLLLRPQGLFVRAGRKEAA